MVEPNRLPVWRWRRRLLPRLAGYVLLGAAAAVGAAVVLAGNMDPRQGPTVAAERVEGLLTWSVRVTRRPGAMYVESARERAKPAVVSYASWSVEQATGPPDTAGYGDIGTAWTTPLQDNPQAQEWLELDYPAAVVPAAVHVYETYNPGAVVRVAVYRPADGAEVEAWKGTDPSLSRQQSSVSQVPLAGVDFPVNRVRLYLDTAKVPGWNEIDAVGLVGADGSTQWATAARAGASYGTSPPRPPPPDRVTSPPPEQVAPAWTGFDRPGPAFAQGRADTEERGAAAFGWPFPVLAGTHEAVPPPPPLPPSPGPAAPMSTTIELDSLESTSLVGGLQPSGWVGSPPAPVVPAGPTAPAAAGTQIVPRPTRILWGGLAADAVLFAPVLALLRWLSVAPRRFVREVGRIRSGRCLACGYDLGYDFIPGCPECGWRRGPADAGRWAEQPAPAASAVGTNGDAGVVPGGPSPANRNGGGSTAA